MLVRLLTVASLIAAGGACWTADAPVDPPADAPSTGSAKLSEEALNAKLAETQKSLMAKKFTQGTKADPATVKQELDTLGELVANAAEPKGVAATGARLMRTQLWMLTGQDAKAEPELKSIIGDGVDDHSRAGAFMLLAMMYDEGNRGDDLVALAADAEKAKIDPQVQQQLSGLAEEILAAKKAGVVVGQPFPDVSFTDTKGAKRSLADFKGKVVLLDFWATWCPPCVAELPNVKAVYEADHAKGFEVLGISLDQDRGKLDKFIADKAIPWPQYFDGKGWENAISTRFSIHSIPATFLIDGDGKLIAKGVRGETLKTEVEKALAALKAAPAAK